jgi:branched-chain amino acid transport system ATP-binding protein
VIALDVAGLSLQFGGLRAIDDLSFAVEAGERLVILGPNGAGKTTLFNVISGMLRPTSGRIALFGQEVTRASVARRVRLGLGRTFQIATLFPRLTVLESAMLAMQAGEPQRFVMHRSMDAYPGTRRRAIELLEEWQLGAQADRETRHLSYGEQRRVELVLALARRPRLLLLDEPAAGLSGEETALVEDMVGRLSREVTVLMIEHDVDMALRLADRVIVLQQGRLLASGTPGAIRDDPRVAEIYFGAGHA